MEQKNQMGTYESPELKVLDLCVEGVLCGNPNGGHQDWNEDNDLWS